MKHFMLPRNATTRDAAKLPSSSNPSISAKSRPIPRKHNQIQIPFPGQIEESITTKTSIFQSSQTQARS
ncbi:TRAFAC class myosin-kinesin ATPase super [Trifolium repens]|nr:TRAFAC class myosin-kinesin ATPase super [Trifolium repens]